MIKKIKRWWRWEAKYFPRNVKHGLRNLIQWFPIIWKDRDWDQTYIWDILEHKLKNQSHHIKHYGHHTDKDHDSRNMLICANLIKKIKEDYYDMEYIDYNSCDFNFIPNDDSSLYEMVSSTNWEKFDDFFKKYPRIYKKLTINGEPKTTEDKKRVAMKIAHTNHKRAIRLLFKIMEEHIERWWD